MGTAVGGVGTWVQAEGSPEEAEVGRLEQRGVSGGNKVVKEVLDVRKERHQKTKLFFSSSLNIPAPPLISPIKTLLAALSTPRRPGDLSPRAAASFTSIASIGRRLNGAEAGFGFLSAGPRHSKLIRHSRKSQRRTDQRKVATRRQIRPVLSSVSPAGTPHHHHPPFIPRTHLSHLSVAQCN